MIPRSLAILTVMVAGLSAQTASAPKPAVAAEPTPESAAVSKDPWAKVAKLASATDLKIFLVGDPPDQWLVAKFDELTADNLLIVVRDQQRAIAREKIAKIEARLEAKTSGLSSRTRQVDPLDVNSAQPQYAENKARPPVGATRTRSNETSFSVKLKPTHEVVYKRPE